MALPVETIAFAVTLIGLTYAAYTDLKTRTVNDLIPIGFVVLGFLLSLFASFAQSDYSILGTAVAVTIGTFIGGYLLWKIGFWAGGDVKLFTGIAMLNPYNFAALAGLFNFQPFFPTLSFPIFPLSLLIISALCMLPIGIILTIIRLWQKPVAREKIFSELQKKVPGIILFSLWITGVHALLVSFGQPDYFVILGALVYWGFAKLPEKIRWVICGTVFLYAAFLSDTKIIAELAATLLILSGAALILSMISNAKHVFRSEKKIADLAEGDIVAVTLVEKNGIIEEKTPFSWQEMIKNPKKPMIPESKNQKEREICSSQSANGLENGQISELKELARQKKIGETIMIKESTAFVPAIWVAYVLLQGIGDPLGLVTP